MVSNILKPESSKTREGNPSDLRLWSRCPCHWWSPRAIGRLPPRPCDRPASPWSTDLRQTPGSVFFKALCFQSTFHENKCVRPSGMRWNEVEWGNNVHLNMLRCRCPTSRIKCGEAIASMWTRYAADILHHCWGGVTQSCPCEHSTLQTSYVKDEVGWINKVHVFTLRCRRPMSGMRCSGTTSMWTRYAEDVLRMSGMGWGGTTSMWTRYAADVLRHGWSGRKQSRPCIHATVLISYVKAAMGWDHRVQVIALRWRRPTSQIGWGEAIASVLACYAADVLRQEWGEVSQ